MKCLLFRILPLVLVFLSSAQASALRIEGTATWSITKPDCTIEVVGAIQNLSPINTVSGTLKLALWVTPAPFPSPGYNVAEAILLPLRGGTQMTDFRKKVPVNLDGLTGTFYFTLVLMEYSGYRWDSRVAVPFGTRKLDNGDFLNDTTWYPKGPFLAPPASVTLGQRLRLQTKANSVLTRITAGTDADTYLTFDKTNELSLRHGSTRERTIYSYKTARDTLRGKSYRTGRVSLYKNGVRQAEIALFFKSTDIGIYRMAGNGRITWGTFVLR